MLLALVVAVTLAIGSGIGRSAPETAAQRASALDTQIRCPVCEDESVAQSSASAAIAVRHQILRMAERGDSDQQIEQSLVGRYGSMILLRPPTSGVAGLVWIIPAVVGGLALAALGALFWRRSRAFKRLAEPTTARAGECGQR